MQRYLVVEDDARLRKVAVKHLEHAGAKVEQAGTIAEALTALAAPGTFTAMLLDMHLSDGTGIELLEQVEAEARPPTIVITGDRSVETVVGALRMGAIGYLQKPFSIGALDAELARLTELPSRKKMVEPVEITAWRRANVPELLGEAPSLVRAIEIAARVAGTDCSLLIHGETGTGKELIARGIHDASGRGKQAYVPVNCAALPEGLMESELFGHVRGAFTGADKSRLGRFVVAHQGTLFLDEIGEMPLSVQAKLLRVLQEKAVTPVGDERSIPVDVRVIAATHRDLDAMVREGKFREDLLYRLDVIRIELPPLRDRLDDISLLVEAFLVEVTRRRGVEVDGIEPAAMSALLAYAWPGNVRELLNAVERMVLLRGYGIVQVDDLPEKVRGAPKPSEVLARAADLPDGGLDLREAVRRFELNLITKALERTGGNKNKAAALLQMNRTTLVEKLKASDRHASAADRDVPSGSGD